jgi:hypothetical protein
LPGGAADVARNRDARVILEIGADTSPIRNDGNPEPGERRGRANARSL